ncbi:ABC transporter permease [Glycomyces salinus]|uniref:ABC transporter permease n=1 Tax=Glycomyces salinus TaxID=980294 RepID=UPI0018EE3951|nr:ABC transporter permease [Glycomyces salinus]
MISDGLRILRYAAASGFADFRTIYTVRTWITGWLFRVLCQVSFFALIGRLIDSPEYTEYLLIGNAVMIAAMESLFVVASTSWERWTGSVPLLIAAPASLALVLCGRSVQWLASGTASATLALFLLSPLFGVDLRLPMALVVIPLIALVGLSTYCFGLILGGLVLRADSLRNVVGNLTMLSLMAISGAQVPVSVWPDWLQALSAVLPVHHGLAAIRGVLSAEMGFTEVLMHVGMEAIVGTASLGVAILGFKRFAESGRRSGAIEFGS